MTAYAEQFDCRNFSEATHERALTAPTRTLLFITSHHVVLVVVWCTSKLAACSFGFPKFDDKSVMGLQFQGEILATMTGQYPPPPMYDLIGIKYSSVVEVCIKVVGVAEMK